MTLMLQYRVVNSYYVTTIVMETLTGKPSCTCKCPLLSFLTEIYVLRYSSPWSNKYIPALEDGFLPSEKLRALEVEFNELFDAYRELYYEGGTSSVYLWDLEQGFAGCFLIKKSKLGCLTLLQSILSDDCSLLCRYWRRRSLREDRLLGLHQRRAIFLKWKQWEGSDLQLDYYCHVEYECRETWYWRDCVVWLPHQTGKCRLC